MVFIFILRASTESCNLRKTPWKFFFHIEILNSFVVICFFFFLLLWKTKLTDWHEVFSIRFAVEDNILSIYFFKIGYLKPLRSGISRFSDAKSPLYSKGQLCLFPKLDVNSYSESRFTKRTLFENKQVCNAELQNLWIDKTNLNSFETPPSKKPLEVWSPASHSQWEIRFTIL